MNYGDINLNKVLLSGIINGIIDTNDKYIKFGITTRKYTTMEDKNVYVSLNIARELYHIYKDYFIKGNKIYVKGYLNSYKDKNKKIQSFITVTAVGKTFEEIIKGKKAPHIREDVDGVLIWDGSRCESTPATLEEQKEMENLLSEFK